MFVVCKFNAWDKRGYTYQWDGEPFAPGDEVMVPDPKHADGWKRVIVVSSSDIAPPFACKSIIGKCEPEAPPSPDGMAEQ